MDRDTTSIARSHSRGHSHPHHLRMPRQRHSDKSILDAPTATRSHDLIERGSH